MAENRPFRGYVSDLRVGKSESEAWPGELLQEGLKETVKKRCPGWCPSGWN